MAKFSELFGRKNGDTAAGRPATLRLNTVHGNGNGSSHSPETFSDVGSRIGEENETLRNLLTDTGRRIDELDELKEAFAKIVVPFNGVLRALEQEKSHALGLTSMLNESRAAYETLRGEFYLLEKKATSLEADTEKLNTDLELARESNRAFERSHLELNHAVSGCRARIAELEHQFAHESAQHRTLNQNHRTLQARLDGAEKHNTELEVEIAVARENLALLDDEKRSLQIAADKAFDEASRLAHQLTETENALAATRAQLGKVEVSFTEASTERGRFAAALDENREQRQAEQNTLNMRLEALQSRAATAERLLSETRQNLIVRTEEVRAFDRKSVEATIARNNAEKRLAQSEAAQIAREKQFKDLEQARAALAERNNAVTKTLKAREGALARAEEKVAALTARNGRLEADVQVSRTNIEKRIDELNSALQRERMERAVVEGALEAVRKDNSRLQSEVAALRSTLRRGLPLDEAPVAPDSAANDEAPAKTGKSAETA